MLPCSNNTTLIFEYKPDQSGQMRAYLTINKNNESIPFRFSTTPYKVKVDGQMVTRFNQAGLGVFATVLEGYLRGTGINLHLSKLSEEELDDQLTPPPVENNGQYQTM